jgi:putative transposase
LFSRQVVGFAMSERMTRQLFIGALRMAWFRRRPMTGLIFHSDRGSQTASGDFQKQLSIGCSSDRVRMLPGTYF